MKKSFKTKLKDKLTKTQTIILSILLLLVILGLAGFALGFFNTVIGGNDNAKGTEVGTGISSLVISDSSNITVSDFYPGDDITKTFTITNTGNVGVKYNLIWEDLTNGFSRPQDLTYTITSLNGGGTLSSTQLPNTGTNLEILSDIYIAPNIIQIYTVTFSYANLANTNQDADIGSSFNGVIDITNAVARKNLVTNGNLELGDNTNFSGWTYDASTQSLYKTVSEYSITNTSDYIEVNTNKTYKHSMDLKSSPSTTNYYIGIVEYDRDYNIISTCNVYYFPTTTTTLSEQLNNGDTVVHFASLENWVATSSTPSYQLSLAFWNYSDSTGYTYPVGTYTRNSWYNLYTYDNVNKTNNTITLSSAWTHGTIPSGTSVSQSSGGSTYNYGIKAGGTLPTSWTRLSNTLTGTWENGTQSVIKFRPGTKYIKPFIYFYSNIEPNTTLYIKNIEFIQMD